MYSDSALVIIGHGSTLNPDSSEPTQARAEALRRRGLFAEVVCAFWKEEPSLREVLRMIDSPQVFIVPNFISEGYFTREVIPRELGLTGAVTHFPRHTVHYCDPVGLHPSMTKLLLKRAAEVAPDVPRDECSLVIVGHGTTLNENSARAVKDQVQRLREGGHGFAEVVDAYMEEEPLVSAWSSLTTAPNVIVVPFFIADGLHSYEDIPEMLGMARPAGAGAGGANLFRRNPWRIGNRNLYYSRAIGTEPMLAEVILDQVQLCGGDLQPPSSRPASPPLQEPVHSPGQPTICASLESWLKAGGRRIGEAVVLVSDNGWLLCHHLDASHAGTGTLTRHSVPEAAREIAKRDEAGAFRPLKTAPTLRRGWEIFLTTTADLHLALDLLYPAALGNWLRVRSREAVIPTLRETLNRQSGIYRITALVHDDEARSAIATTCADEKCLRRIQWRLDETQPAAMPKEKRAAPESAPESGAPIPLLCTDACPLLIGAIRNAVRKRMKGI